MIALIFFVIAVVLFLIAALGIGDFDQQSLLLFGLAAFTAGHIPWDSLNLPQR